MKVQRPAMDWTSYSTQILADCSLIESCSFAAGHCLPPLFLKEEASICPTFYARLRSHSPLQQWCHAQFLCSLKFLNFYAGFGDPLPSFNSGRSLQYCTLLNILQRTQVELLNFPERFIRVTRFSNTVIVFTKYVFH